MEFLDGLVLTGYFVGLKERSGVRDNGQAYHNFRYNVTTEDGDVYYVTSEDDYRSDIKFGDRLSFLVTVNVFNNNAYYKGVKID